MFMEIVLLIIVGFGTSATCIGCGMRDSVKITQMVIVSLILLSFVFSL